MEYPELMAADVRAFFSDLLFHPAIGRAADMRLPPVATSE
jgi:hypothetical protein